MDSAWVNAASGTPPGLTELVEVFGVVPDVTPELAEEPLVEAGGVITLGGGVNALEPGVYLTPVVRALEPAEDDAEEENEVDAPAPAAPDDPFAWMYSELRLEGFFCHSGAVSSTTWY